MQKINRMAAIVVWRAFGFCWLAIAAVMSGLIFDLALACRVGAVMALLVALALEFKADTYHRIKYINECEVWILLGEANRPPKALARQLIVPAMRDELREKALYSAVMGGGLILIALTLRLLWG